MSFSSQIRNDDDAVPPDNDDVGGGNHGVSGEEDHQTGLLLKPRPKTKATDIMLHVHRRGDGICGIFTYEVAETKVAQVMDFARANEQPLQCTMEKE